LYGRDLFVPGSSAPLAQRTGSIHSVVGAWGLLEWIFVIILLGLAGAVGAAFLFLIGTLFVNPGRRKRST
jgi:hypothetical protein